MFCFSLFSFLWANVLPLFGMKENWTTTQHRSITQTKTTTTTTHWAISAKDDAEDGLAEAKVNGCSWSKSDHLLKSINTNHNRRNCCYDKCVSCSTGTTCIQFDRRHENCAVPICLFADPNSIQLTAHFNSLMSVRGLNIITTKRSNYSAATNIGSVVQIKWFCSNVYDLFPNCVDQQGVFTESTKCINTLNHSSSMIDSFLDLSATLFSQWNETCSVFAVQTLKIYDFDEQIHLSELF